MRNITCKPKQLRQEVQEMGLQTDHPLLEDLLMGTALPQVVMALRQAVTAHHHRRVVDMDLPQEAPEAMDHRHLVMAHHHLEWIGQAQHPH
mmetsp:Transcript_68469/g.121145  ORF Transcript_68469/g.121145 Transcript_68469/m.121145 type:complete len:91 (+) Transcript_68469:730-1002(+)